MSGVFLSYAREDLPFVRRLHDALATAGRDPAWDQDHAVVPFSAPYQSEIDTAIAGSEKFIFVISPDSLDSDPCAAELAVAVQSNKHIIPLLRRQARDRQPIPEAVAERNWIFFDDDARFDASFEELIQTLDTDLDWVKVHTRLLVRTREWTDGGGDRSRLLRGRDLREAEAWLAKGMLTRRPRRPVANGRSSRRPGGLRTVSPGCSEACWPPAWSSRSCWPRSPSSRAIRRYRNEIRRSITRQAPKASGSGAVTPRARPSSTSPPTISDQDRTWPHAC